MPQKVVKNLKYLLPNTPKKQSSQNTCIFQIVVDDYAQSFRDLLPFEFCSSKDPKVMGDFAEALFKVRERHTNTVIIMAEAVMEMKVKAQREGQMNGSKKGPRFMENIQYFLDRLYTSRISTRMLINQHTALFTEVDKVSSKINELHQHFTEMNRVSIFNKRYIWSIFKAMLV